MQAFCYDWGDKRKIETAAVTELYRGLEKNASISELYMRGGVALKETRHLLTNK